MRFLAHGKSLPNPESEPYPKAWLRHWAVSESASLSGAFVTKPGRYSRILPARKGQLHKPGILHNLHTEWTKLQKETLVVKIK